MRAIQITQPGGPDVLNLRDVPTPVPAAEQVLIRVRAAGVNRPDVLLREGKYGGAGDVAGLVPGSGSSGRRGGVRPRTPRVGSPATPCAPCLPAGRLRRVRRRGRPALPAAARRLESD